MTIIPEGFGSATLTFSTVGSTHNSQLTFGFLNDDTKTPLQIGGQLWNFFTQVGKPFINSNMDVNWAIEGIKIQMTPPLLGPVVYELISHIQGSGSQSAAPMNSAFIINKFTGFAGRKYRGRMFCPPAAITEGAISSAGILDPAGLASQNSRWRDTLTAMAAGGTPMYLLHNDATEPTPVVDLFLSPKVGTLKRRLRS